MASRRYGTKQRAAKGRICASKECGVLLSIFNDDEVCASCYKKIDLRDLPLTMGAYL
jgi:hypothetical protein